MKIKDTDKKTITEKMKAKDDWLQYLGDKVIRLNGIGRGLDLEKSQFWREKVIIFNNLFNITSSVVLIIAPS